MADEKLNTGPAENTYPEARQHGGTEKAAPWPSAESGKGCD